MAFVNRQDELARLREWWAAPGSGLALVWGRRRVGKTALVQKFSRELPVVFHTGTSRPPVDELRELSRAAEPRVGCEFRDLGARPFADWTDAFETLAAAARDSPLLLVLDEFPEIRATAPEVPSVLRAVWDRVRSRTRLRILLCGSAVRTMSEIQEERAPLFGRIDLRLRIHPFRPHEAARMLTRLAPADRALVWGLVGGIPLYLEWWDQDCSVRQNLLRLVGTPGGPLLTEGEYVLATEGGHGGVARLVLHAIAGGRTRFNEISQTVGANPHRVLEDLIEARLVERLAPVTEQEVRTRRTTYRLADNFLAFWLRIVDRHRSEIDRGLGRTVMPVIMKEIQDHMGARWEEAFRAHLRRIAERIHPETVAVGPFWSGGPDPCEIDAVVLAGRGRTAVLVGEAKWSKRVDGPRVLRDLLRKSAALPSVAADVQVAVAARVSVDRPEGLLAFTAADIFAPV